MLWDLDNALDMAIAVAMDTRWGDLNTEELEETAKKLMQRCKKLPKPTKASSAFKALDTVSYTHLTLPTILLV